MDAELDLDFFWSFLGVANEVPMGLDSNQLHLEDILGLYCGGGEL
jgi:hypothetical protein